MMKVKKASAKKPHNFEIAEEVVAVNLVFERSNAEDVEPEKVITVKNTSLIFKCYECSYKIILTRD